MKEQHILGFFKKTSTPKVIVLGGMHGNELSGIEAIQNVITILKNKPEIHQKGSIFFLQGNINALKKNERFIDKDLNRLWQDEFIFNNDPNISEFKDLRHLYQLIVNDICEENFENCYFLDLHTFSAQSGIFCIPSNNQKSLNLAASFQVPFIEKLADSLPGTAISYLGKKGITGVVLEGGTHNTPEATENLTSGILHFLSYANVLDPKVNLVKKATEKLNIQGKTYPYHLELIYRHHLHNSTQFKMKKGYFNFKKISKDEILALDNNNEIKSPEQGFILMPLYQKKGSDGFFIVKEIMDIYKKKYENN